MRAIFILTILASFLADRAAAQDLQSAKAFLTSIYKDYVPARRNTPTVWGRWIAPSLEAVLKRDYEITPKDEMPSLNGDPICGCQEWEITSVAITVRGDDDGEAVGTPSFLNFGRPSRIRFRLQATNKGWRIADIMSDNMPSLRQYVLDDIQHQTFKCLQWQTR